MIKNIILLLFIVPIINTSCNNTVPIEKIVYVPVKDTINEQENIAKIIRLEYELSLYKDSLNYIRDSLGQENQNLNIVNDYLSPYAKLYSYCILTFYILK